MNLLEEKFYKRIKNLIQYKGYDEKQLRDVAKTLADEQVNPKVEEIDVEGMFVNNDEKREARKLLNKYLSDYTIETIAEKNTLLQLIFLEVLNNRLQNELNELQREKISVNPKVIANLHNNLTQIVNLKDKLGLTKEKAESTKSDAFKALEILQKKFKAWKENNQASRSLLCPHCQELVLLKIRTDIWEAQKHPFFKDRILGNTALIKLYQEQKISKYDVAKVLECSEDYIDWLIDKWNLIPNDYFTKDSLTTNTIELNKEIPSENLVQS